MPGQPGKNVSVRYKVESVFGTAVSGAGAEELRIAPGNGLSLRRQPIEDPEVRSDGQRSMARLGSELVEGSYPVTLSVDSFDTWLEALWRSTWSAASAITSTGAGTWVDFTVASATSITRTGTGDFTTIFKVGDVFVITNYSTAGNNNINLRVTSLTSSQVNFVAPAGVTITAGAADTSCTLTRLRKLQNSSTLTRRSYTIEEYFTDLDESELFVGCRVVSLSLRMQPDGVVSANWGIMGQDMSLPGTAASPNFTSPTQYTTIGLVAVDASLRVNGVEMATVTGLDLRFDLGASGMPVIGSTRTPDIFEGAMSVSGTMTAVRTALTGSTLATFLAETDNIELHVLLEEPDATLPKDCLALFLPRVKYTGVETELGQDTGVVETVSIYAAAKASGVAGYDAITAMWATTAA